MAESNITITPDIRNRIRTFITERSGLYFKDHDLRNLEQAIAVRMKTKNITSVPGYYSFLTGEANREEELRELLNLLTINHTYFFRNEPHFKALRDKVLPELIEKRTAEAKKHNAKPTLRIWSAGCSSGQEPYSIAMTLIDLIGNINEWDIQIIATDASSAAIETARKGIYPESSLKHVDSEHLQTYFSLKQGERNNTFEIHNRVKRLVDFGFHNLISDDFLSNFDLIFCRNVVIYFEFETTVSVMTRFHASLLEDGFLFIGYSENLHFMKDSFNMVSWQDAIYYTKVSTKTSQHTEVEKDKLKQLEQSSLEQILEEISKKERLADLQAEKKTQIIPPQKIEDILVQALKAMHMKNYPKALLLVKEAIKADEHALDPHYLAAEIYLNKAELTLARNHLAIALKINALYAPAHYLLGCMSLEEGRIEEAREQLRKAIFIDSTFLMAYFYMAQVSKNEGRDFDAIREYRNTLNLLSKIPSDDIIPYSGGFLVATLMSVCRDNLERLKGAV